MGNKLSKKEVENIKSKMLSMPFFHKKSIIGNGRFSIVLNKDKESILKVTCDKGFYLYMTSDEMPNSIHYPRLVMDFGAIQMNKVEVYTVEMEKLYPLVYTDIYNNCIANLKENFAIANRIIRDKETSGYAINQIDYKIDAIAKSFAKEFPNVKNAIYDLRDFAVKNNLSLNRYFLSPFENMMVREDETLVFANPLCDLSLFDEDVLENSTTEFSDLMEVYKRSRTPVEK